MARGAAGLLLFVFTVSSFANVIARRLLNAREHVRRITHAPVSEADVFARDLDWNVRLV